VYGHVLKANEMSAHVLNHMTYQQGVNPNLPIQYELLWGMMMIMGWLHVNMPNVKAIFGQTFVPSKTGPKMAVFFGEGE